MRHDYCEKNGISITYNDENVCFEDLQSAEAIVFANDGTILINNYNDEKTEFFKEWFQRIYLSITYFRSLDRLEAVG